MASQLHCLQVNCPGRKVLGPQQGSLRDVNTVDPLHLLLPNFVYNMSAGAVLKMIQDAIDAYILRDFNGKLGERGRLEIYPILPDPGTNNAWEDVLRNYFSHDAAVGAILAGNSDLANFMADPNILPAHKNFIQDRLKKYQGEKGEERSLVGCIHAMIGNEGAIIHSHKTVLSLLEDTLEKNQTLTPEERLDVQFALLGLTPNKNTIKTQVSDLVNKYFIHYGGLGTRTIPEIEAVITNVTADTTENDRQKAARKKDMELLKNHLLENHKSSSPSFSLDPFVPLYLAKLRKQLNQHKREHDITVLRPDFKTVVQVEVKTATANVNRINQVVEGALQQLRGGQKEMKRVHGHLLDQDWSFFGMIALPNLTSQDRDSICNQKNICAGCKPFILVDNISTELTTLFAIHFTSKFPDEATWHPAYVSLLSRMLSMVAMVPSLPGDRITGTTEPLVGGFTVKDIIKLEKCDIAEVQKMREAGHRGSPVKIMFLNKTQLTTWEKRLVAFLADYGVGKTTLLAAKAMSLASLGESVGIFFLHEGKDGVEPVMGLWNKKKFSSLSSNITALSTADLRQFYRSNGGRQKLSGIQLVLYYLKHGPNHIEQVFIDEAAMEGSRYKPDETATVQALKRLSDHLPPTSHLWVAYHSQHLVEDGSTPVNRGQLCLELTGHGFTIPSLFHNMRNSDQVARAAAAVWSTTGGMDLAILPPVAPPSLTPPCKPLYIKCKSYEHSDYGAGVVCGYSHIQAASNTAAPPVVVLCERYLSDSVRTCLEAEGVPVTSYWTQADTPAMEIYMVCPGGVLLIGGDTFSGMEAVNVISVEGVAYRSGVLRATQTLVYISYVNPSEELKAVCDVLIM